MQPSFVSPIGGITLVIQAIVEILSDANDYEEGLKELMKLAGFTGKFGSSKSTGSRGSMVAGNTNNGKTNTTTNAAVVRPFPMIATCAFYLLPELRKMFVDYADDIIQEVSSQVQQDTWSTIATSYLEITPNGAEAMNASGDVTDVSPSYIWMVTAMNHLLSEIVVLLNKETMAGSYGPDARSMALLTRLEVSEVCVDVVMVMGWWRG